MSGSSGDKGIIAYGAYLPRHRVRLSDVSAVLGISAGKGVRVVASFDEDSTTMAVAAAQAALAGGAVPKALYLATTSPAYADKANATAVHAALDLPDEVFAADVAGSARSAIAALRVAARTDGLAALADVRTGRPGSPDERGGGDGAAAFVFGDVSDAVALLIAESSSTAEFLDRWRDPAAQSGGQWEERFGLEQYLPLITRVAATALRDADIDCADHVVLVSPNTGVTKRAGKALTGRLSTTTSPIGHAGAADVGLALADVLDRAGAGETVLVVSAADGCDAFVLRTTDRISEGRQPVSVADQLAAGTEVGYGTYLSWRGILDRESPRRPEPDRAAAPPSARATRWKFAFTGTRCTHCAFVHLPPAPVCKRCHVTDGMTALSMAHSKGTVATFTVDRLAYSPGPPVVAAVIDFDGGGRYTLEIADTAAEGLAVGSRVQPTFRKLNTAGGVHNYFWKARLLPNGEQA
ncbi:OB-fold domain-containing protein [Nocardia sp. NPDC050175]|uniref:OB-fold domain-containing protein n=1 Tax=Nocardia sp. NPDC050175 TaxID=3364317 RepID=UPI0037984007